MCYIYLILAILFEVAAVILVKESNALTVLLPAIAGFVSYGLSFTFAGFSVKKLDVSFVYAVWSSLALILVFCIGILFYGDVINLLKIISALMILCGIVGFSFAGAKH